MSWRAGGPSLPGRPAGGRRPRRPVRPYDLLTAAGPHNGLVRLAFRQYDADDLPSLVTCSGVRELELDGCSALTELPSLDALTQLTKLVISGCDCLTELEEALSSCSALLELRISDNQRLDLLPAGLGRCTALRALSVESGYIRYEEDAAPYDSLQLPKESLTALTALTSLTLHACWWRTLPDLRHFPQLAALDLERCPFHDAYLAGGPAESSECCPLAKLTELRLAFCCREGTEDLGRTADGSDATRYYGAVLPPAGRLPNLRALRLEGYNSLDEDEEFPDLHGLTSLTRLELRECVVSDLDVLTTLTSLVDLRISLCPNVEKLPSLVSLGQLRLVCFVGCHYEKLGEETQVGDAAAVQVTAHTTYADDNDTDDG